MDYPSISSRYVWNGLIYRHRTRCGVGLEPYSRAWLDSFASVIQWTWEKSLPWRLLLWGVLLSNLLIESTIDNRIRYLFGETIHNTHTWFLNKVKNPLHEYTFRINPRFYRDVSLVLRQFRCHTHSTQHTTTPFAMKYVCWPRGK